MPEIDPQSRPARLEDLDRICALNVQVHSFHLAENPLRYRELHADDPRLRAHHRRCIEDPDTVLMVRCDPEGLVVGYLLARWRVFEDSPFLNDAVELHVDQIVVDAEHRGQGHGQELLDRAMRAARGQGADRLSLGVAIFNDRARKMFERVGFQVIGRVMVRRA
ncbi:MAG: GNAT family N-acetyltransferase [Myxococcota bacterium]|nr:GNAT family N-acetyltransferase [Myxococcota bacterium]